MLCKRDLKAVSKKTPPAWSWRVPCAGPAAGPELHCAYYSWNMWACERVTSAAGILGAALLTRIREKTLAFVMKHDCKALWEVWEFLKETWKFKHLPLLFFLKPRNKTQKTNKILSLRVKGAIPVSISMMKLWRTTGAEFSDSMIMLGETPRGAGPDLPCLCTPGIFSSLFLGIECQRSLTAYWDANSSLCLTGGTTCFLCR